MKLGVQFDLRNPKAWERPWASWYSQSLELISWCDDLGADSVWLTEHHFFEDGYLPQPLTFAAAIAARTSRIRIGTAVLVATLRSPIQVAEESAVVDILSNGRLDLGIGAGWKEDEFTAFGQSYNNKLSRAISLFEQLPEMWFGGKVTPAPVQSPIPIWAGFHGPRGAWAAGKAGVGLLASERNLLEPYFAGCAERDEDATTAHKNGGQWSAQAHFMLADDPEKAWREIAPYFLYMGESYGYPPIDIEALTISVLSGPGERTAKSEQVLGGEKKGNSPPDQGDLRHQFRVLTPQDAEKHLRARFSDMPIEQIYCWGSICAMPDDLTARHIELLFSELAPRLRDFEPLRSEVARDTA